MRSAFELGCAVLVIGVAQACAGDVGNTSDGGAGTGNTAGTGSSTGGTASGGKGGSAGTGGSAGKGGTGGKGGSGGTGGSGGSMATGGTGGSIGPGGVTTYGQPYTGGQFHLGPVDWQESQFHNACAPVSPKGYSAQVSSAEGMLLAGLWGSIDKVSNYCDACIYVQTAKGKSAVLRVVTYGATSPNSIDVSPDAYAILNSGEYPRAMTWQFAKCPDTGKIMYEFQSGSSEYWTSFWVRNARVPLTKVEVKSANYPNYTEPALGTDGTRTLPKPQTSDPGFGVGPFSIRLTGMDGQVIVDDFAWPSGGVKGITLTGKGNFQ